MATSANFPCLPFISALPSNLQGGRHDSNNNPSTAPCTVNTARLSSHLQPKGVSSQIQFKLVQSMVRSVKGEVPLNKQCWGTGCARAEASSSPSSHTTWTQKGQRSYVRLKKNFTAQTEGKLMTLDMTVTPHEQHSAGNERTRLHQN